MNPTDIIDTDSLRDDIPDFVPRRHTEAPGEGCRRHP